MVNCCPRARAALGPIFALAVSVRTSGRPRSALVLPTALLALLLGSAISLASSSAFAASYQQFDGFTTIDPIQSVSGGNHPYSGNDLEPGADLSSADLNSADLFKASLFEANLTSANLSGAYLYSADLDSAILTGADLTGATLVIANLSGANLSLADLTDAVLAGSVGLETSVGAALYSVGTNFEDTGFDPVAAGWTLVPEPSAALLLGFGLSALAVRRTNR